VIPQATHKRCSSCSEWLPFEDFPKNKLMHNGLSSHCRTCHNAAVQDWRERNRDEINRARREAYRAERPLPTRPCIVCGEPFSKRTDALVCGERCRNRRKDEQRKVA
jgi:hypothetical protein